MSEIEESALGRLLIACDRLIADHDEEPDERIGAEAWSRFVEAVDLARPKPTTQSRRALDAG